MRGSEVQLGMFEGRNVLRSLNWARDFIIAERKGEMDGVLLNQSGWHFKEDVISSFVFSLANEFPVNLAFKILPQFCTRADQAQWPWKVTVVSSRSRYVCTHLVIYWLFVAQNGTKMQGRVQSGEMSIQIGHFEYYALSNEYVLTFCWQVTTHMFEKPSFLSYFQ